MEIQSLELLIDEFQFLGCYDAQGVPNSNGPFGENFPASGKVLASKVDNAEHYSKMMAEKGGSTVSLDENYAAIHEFVVGKTVARIRRNYLKKTQLHLKRWLML